MGNRAVIAFRSQPLIGIYLHWEGSAGSVEAFLKEAERRGARRPGSDPTYAFASLCGVCYDAVGRGGLSFGVGPLSRLDTDNGDNGTYWVGDTWAIDAQEPTPDTDASYRAQRLSYWGPKLEEIDEAAKRASE